MGARGNDLSAILDPFSPRGHLDRYVLGNDRRFSPSTMIRRQRRSAIGRPTDRRVGKVIGPVDARPSKESGGPSDSGTFSLPAPNPSRDSPTEIGCNQHADKNARSLA